MKKTVIGIVTFGNLEFTQLAVQSVWDTVKSPYKLCIIVGKPGDGDTAGWCARNDIPHIVHNQNYGFPYSLNDLYDFTWEHWKYDNLVTMGNDVIAYPYAIDSLISVEEKIGYDWLCSQEYNVKALVKDFPEVRPLFNGEDLKFASWKEKPWERFTGWSDQVGYDVGGGMSDTHNLALYTRSFFDQVGYIDVNHYPAYFEDNDLARRAILAGTKSAKVTNSYYFHFWSRTIKQGSGGSNNKFFNLNRNYYIRKWGGDFMKERFSVPFNGAETEIGGVRLPNSYKIDSREGEDKIIAYWRSKA